MPAEVESDQTHAGRRAVHAARLTQIAAQAVLKDKRQAVAFVAVVESKSVTIKKSMRSYSCRDKPQVTISRRNAVLACDFVLAPNRA